jgi:hypothetical protein
MTPKEKAEELFNKMFSIDELFGSVGVHEAKQCALIAVDEIKKAGIHPFDQMYWDGVKQEIEKL